MSIAKNHIKTWWNIMVHLNIQEARSKGLVNRLIILGGGGGVCVGRLALSTSDIT